MRSGCQKTSALTPFFFLPKWGFQIGAPRPAVGHIHSHYVAVNMTQSPNDLCSNSTVVLDGFSGYVSCTWTQDWPAWPHMGTGERPSWPHVVCVCVFCAWCFILLHDHAARASQVPAKHIARARPRCTHGTASMHTEWLRSQTTNLVRNIRAVNDLLDGSWSTRANGFLARIATMPFMYVANHGVVHRCL